jgi:hypothetical protein
MKSPGHPPGLFLSGLSGSRNAKRLLSSQPALPSAGAMENHATVQVIGSMKMRSRTVRGYKSHQWILNGLLLAGSMIRKSLVDVW